MNRLEYIEYSYKLIKTGIKRHKFYDINKKKDAISILSSISKNIPEQEYIPIICFNEKSMKYNAFIYMGNFYNPKIEMQKKELHIITNYFKNLMPQEILDVASMGIFKFRKVANLMESEFLNIYFVDKKQKPIKVVTITLGYRGFIICKN